MKTDDLGERMLFTFQSNGQIDGKRMVEASVEHLLIHEAPVGPDTDKRSWFGSEDSLAEDFRKIGFTELDVQGILGALGVNRVSTREVEVLAGDLKKIGFAPAA